MRFCVTAYVFGNYKRFIPFFCYSVVKSYPRYSVKIFVDGELGAMEKSCIEEIRQYVSENVVVEEHAFESISPPDAPWIRGGGKVLLRWLFERKDFDGFDCVYFSDIDFLVLRQEPALAEFHTDNARSLGLPFSNMIRANKEDPSALSKRLTGLHFVMADPYFERIDPAVQALKEDPALLADAARNATCDEHFLYYLVDQCITLDSTELITARRPLPGIHLAWARNRRKLDARAARVRHSGNRARRPFFPALESQLRSFCDDSVFLRILWRLRVTEVAVILAKMRCTPSRTLDHRRFSLLLMQARLEDWQERVKSKLGLGSA